MNKWGIHYSCCYLIVALVFVFSGTFFVGCSVTKNLPQGEELYVGNKIILDSTFKKKNQHEVATELKSTLDKTPSTRLFGLLPIPFKMWVYNDFVNSKTVVGRWIFKTFAPKNPLFISTLSPDVRSKIATNLLHDYGFFNGDVSYRLKRSKKDSLKVKVIYDVKTGNPYLVDTFYYHNFNEEITSLLSQRRTSRLEVNRQFNVIDLDTERDNITSYLRNRGYYFFTADGIKFEADTLGFFNEERVRLRVVPLKGLPDATFEPYSIGQKRLSLFGSNREEQLSDSLRYKDLTIYYNQPLKVKPKYLYHWLTLNNDSLNHSNGYFNQSQNNKVQKRLSEIGIFRLVDFQYHRVDSINNILNLDVNLALDKPLDAQLSCDVVTKSNSQLGPELAFSVTKKNIFHGGESLNFKLRGSYEWQLGSDHSNALLNSWEIGVSTALKFPRILAPGCSDKFFQYGADTEYTFYVNQLNRAKYYRFLSFGINAAYNINTSPLHKHSFTPLELTFNVLQSYTEAFAEIAKKNSALYISLKDQFIPAMEYNYTYDDSSLKNLKHHFWWKNSVISSGNITSCLYRLAGSSFDEQEKKFLGVPFAQFFKLNTDFRYLYQFTPTSSLVFHLGLGAIFCYGNSTIAPFNQQFYVGGANSIRAFSIRSIGPGGFHAIDNKNSFWDETGTFRFETNLEYRFSLYKKLSGALFFDAGNVWLLREDPNRPKSKLDFSAIGSQIALGTGLGLRYDIGPIVFRYDIGVPLHYPYYTGKGGYYNVKGRILSHLNHHIAIGYPF